MDSRSCIRIVGARQHNLKNIDVELPRGVITAITGVSGSGKSSLAFDTLYAEGQRRYVESLSTQARQFLEQMPKPDVDRIEGLPPTIAIEQRAASPSPRSTVATSTEIYDYLRVLYARVGEPRCWKCDRPITRQSTAQMVDAVLSGPMGKRIMVLAPLVQEQRGGHKTVLEHAVKEGFVRARIDGDVVLLEDVKNLSPRRKHTIEVVVDRITTKAEVAQRLADSVELAGRLSGGRVLISAEIASGRWSDERFSAALACPVHPEVRMEELSPRLFSFNSPQGACGSCHGLGITLKFDPELVVPDMDLSLAEGAIAAWKQPGQRRGAMYARLTKNFCERFGVLPDIPFRHIHAPLAEILLHGTTSEDEKRYGYRFEGVMAHLQRQWESTHSDSLKQRLHPFLDESPCPRCKGDRLRNEAVCVKIDGRNIAEVTKMTVSEAVPFFERLTWTGEVEPVTQPLLLGIRERLRFLRDAGVSYLALNRASATLSGGEWQRIRLATQIGSGLAGICYVLDEPTIGLHPRDSRRLVDILQKLARMGNTVLVVEHDEEVIRGADHLIDIGPGAGEKGGRIVTQGPIASALRSKESLTVKYLTGQCRISPPDRRRTIDWRLSVKLCGVTANNLQRIDVRFPLGCFVCVTGVSGSGKSTLVSQVLLRAVRRQLHRSGPRPGPFEKIVGCRLIDRVVEVDPSPIGRTSRSNPATYVGVMDMIRRLYAQTRTAKIRGYGPARFSFNVKGGRCEHCEGQGTRRVTMHFLPDVFVRCGECGGRRYNRETLEVRYRGKNIANVLDLHVEEALRFFENLPPIRKRLQVLKDVGLGYITLGQSSHTLSGGEAQRIKLASELHRSDTGHTLYVLDEPTTGLHFADVRNLLTVLHRLVDQGHTVLCIEHNLDVIKMADWVIDLGPEGGDAGGRVIVEGTPETIAAHAESHTGKFLISQLANRREALPSEWETAYLAEEAAGETPSERR